MQAVAERAGVSAMTVSNVINGARPVQDEKRKAVLAAIRELGYKPNLAARTLASAMPTHIGILYHNIENAYLSAMLVGAINASSRLGAQLLIERVEDRDPTQVLASMEALKRSGAAAILVPPPYCEIISEAELAAAVSIPVLALSPGTSLANLPSVRIDEIAAAREMTMRLIALGHRRIGFVRNVGWHSSSWTRRDGYRAALEASGLPYDAQLVVNGDVTFESALAAAARLLDMAYPPTAIFASTDDLAVGVVALAHQRGLRIPADLSVAGFDDSPIATRIWPPLTTIRQPVADMADLGVTRLMEQLRRREEDGPRSIAAEYLPYELIERASTGPRPGAS